MTIEAEEITVVEVADNEAPGLAVRLELIADLQDRRPVSPMVETIAEGRKSRAAIMVGVARWTLGRKLDSIHVASIFGVLFREFVYFCIRVILVGILSLAS